MNTPKSKIAAVLSYVTWIGWIVAVVLRSDREEYKDCEFTRRHINQAFFINIISLVSSVLIGLPVPGHFMISGVITLIMMVMWLIGILRAATGIWKPLPIVGEIDLIK